MPNEWLRSVQVTPEIYESFLSYSWSSPSKKPISQELPKVKVSDREMARQISYYFGKNCRISQINEILVDAGRDKLDIDSRELVLNHSDALITMFPLVKKMLHQCFECGKLYKEVNSLYSDEECKTVKEYCYDCYNGNACYYPAKNRWVNFIPPITTITSYHGVNRRLFTKPVNFSDMNLLGLEIETYIPYEKSKIEKIITESCISRKILAERDGSLDSSHGVEFVFLPVPLSEIVEGSFIHHWSSTLKNYQCKAWNAGTDYGMHISINAKSMTDLHCGKFCYFINNNKALCSDIAGRQQNEWQRYESSFKISKYRNNTGKYLAAARRSKERIEVRIFRASLNWERIRRNCEFIHSVIYFTKESSAQNLDLSNYLSFMQQDRNKKQYFQIRKYLGLTKQIQEVLID